MRLSQLLHRTLVSIFCLAVAYAPSVAGQQNKPDPKSTAPVVTEPKPEKPAHKASKVLGDYVPCLFDDQEETSFRSLQSQDSVVTQAQVDKLNKAFLSNLYGKGLNSIISSIPNIVGAESSDALAELVNAIDAVQSSDANLVGAKAFVNNVLSFAEPDWPDDVSCSFSFLRWKETSDVFGRRVANDYVALQINIRNLSTDSEFLVHDIQVAVDSMAPTDYMNRHFSRFQTTRDKLVVRAVAQRGQTEDRRNLVLNTLTMLGAIGGGVNAALQAADAGTALATNYSTGVAIFQGSFLPGFANIFPDHTLEHINHINDMTFSASSTSKTIVPIQGSVPLITFISEAPLEQMPFAMCGRDHIGHFRPVDSAKLTDGTNPGSANYPGCADETLLSSASHKNQNDKDTANSTEDWAEKYSKKVSYKQWMPAALRLLEARTYVVIGGVHINETSTNATLVQLLCPSFSDGTVDLSKIASSYFICSATGTHLSKVSTIVLKAAGSPTAKPISGSVTASGDGTGGVVQFTASDLNAVSGQYSVSLADSTGSNTPTTLTLNFPLPAREPTVETIDLSQAGAGASLIFTIQGTNFDRLGSLTLTAAGGAPITLPAGNITLSQTNVAVIHNTLIVSVAAGVIHAGSYTLAGTAKDGTSVSIPAAQRTVVVR